ncbi:MAG: DUF87 domain-containing protein [Candidatus Caldarchaeum sp.]
MTFILITVVTPVSIMFLIGLGYYAMFTAQQTYMRLKGVNTTPVLDIKSITNQIIYWLSIGFAAVVLILAAILAVRAVVASRRLLGVVPFKDLQKHLLIVGPTGSGKTNTAKQAIKMALKNNVQVVVLDWKAEGGRLTGLRTNGLFRGWHHLMGGGDVAWELPATPRPGEESTPPSPKERR